MKLRKLGISAARTINKLVYNFNRHFKEHQGKNVRVEN
jgi:hypothetical protein